MSYFYIFMTVFFTVYGQFVIKWQVSQVSALPLSLFSKFIFFFQLITNPWIFSGLFAAFLGSLTWMAALTKLPLGYAYPFTSLSFVIVVLFSGIFFNEVVTPLKLIGVALVILGVAVGSQG
jgi:multidrug transporter EmrE-like cation transporter